MDRLPALAPVLVTFLVIAVVSRERVARRLRSSVWLATALVASVGLVVATTLTPLRGAVEPAAIAGRACDVSRMGLAPIAELRGLNDTTLNILLFVPLGAAIALAPRSGAKVALIVAAAASPAVIETVQLTVPFLSRACQSADVFDNLSGLALGWVVGAVVGRFRH
jgi:hypothetical protein